MEISAPNPDYAARYGDFGGAGFWRNINMTPDFPSAAIAIERLFKKVKGVELDGAIAASPQSLAALLKATGPVRVRSLDAVIDARNVVEYTTNSAYSRIRDVEERKRVLGDAAKATFDRFLGGRRGRRSPCASSPGPSPTATSPSTSPTRRCRRRSTSANVSGRLHVPAGDFVAVSASNAAANKLDYYVRRSLAYDVRLKRRRLGAHDPHRHHRQPLPHVRPAALRDRSVPGLLGAG